MPHRIKSTLLVGLQFLFIGLLFVDNALQQIHFVAAIIILLAFFLAVWAIVAMQKSKLRILPEPDVDAILITGGPYHFIRHPMYTAVLLGCAGLLINHFTWMRVAIYIALIMVLIIKLYREEKMLLNKFASYQNYKKYTWRLIPFLFSFSMIIPIYTYSQVKSNGFNFTLKLLLNKSTPSITIEEAFSNRVNYLFLDAREINEYNVSHIQHARHVGDKDFAFKKIADIPKNKLIIVYCSIGKRSEDIVLKMKKAGFMYVKNLYGGIFEWVNVGHPVYGAAGNITDSVHAYSRFWSQYLAKGIKVYR